MKKILSLSLLACLPLCGCPPVVVETAGPPAAEVDVAPGPDAEYYFVGGQYYYWAPGYNRWTVYHGIPDRRFTVHRMGRLPDHPAHRVVRRDVRNDQHRDDDHNEHR